MDFKKQSGFDWLPEGIVHRILSFLNDDDKDKKARYISQLWSKAYRTSKLMFNERNQLNEFIEQKHKTRPDFTDESNDSMIMSISDEELREVRAMFRQEVNRTLSRYTFGGISLPYKLEITMDFITQDDVDDSANLDKWLKIAMENGVRELEINLLSLNPSGYVIPDCILKSESLTLLYLENCKFPNKLNDNGQISCKNILGLKLWQVLIVDEIFAPLMSSCSTSIELLMIEDCRDLRQVKLINVPCLKELCIYDYRVGPVENGLRVEIYAPNLQYVDLGGIHQPCLIQPEAHQNLRKLKLFDNNVTETFFDDFVNKLPNLNSLSVLHCKGFERMNLTSESLKDLSLMSLDSKAPELDINAPNLTSFDFDQAAILPKLSFRANVSPQMESTLHCNPRIDESWFPRLNETLSELFPSRITLRMDLGEFAKNGSSDDLSSFLDDLFLACCPETISLCSSKDKGGFTVSELAGSMLEKLSEMKNYGMIKEQPLDSVSLSDVCEVLEEGKKVSFKLEYWDSPNCCSSTFDDEPTNEFLLIRIVALDLEDDKEKARNLSQDWSKAYDTYPELYFNGSNQENFGDTLMRCVYGGLSLPYQFKITLDFTNHDVDPASLDKWLKLAVENGVRELKIFVIYANHSSYLIPDCILEAKSSLTMLSLAYCKFPDKPIEVQNLCKKVHTLFLQDISIPDNVFSSMIAGCRVVEVMRMENCPKVKLINVPYLKKLRVANCYEAEIDAPNLQIVELRELYGFRFIETRPYQKLQVLKLEVVWVSREFFANFANKFPHLRSLEVRDCGGCEKIDLTSYSLRNLGFRCNEWTEAVPELKIHAPNLTSFDVDNIGVRIKFPKVSLEVVSTQMKSNVSMSYYSYKDRAWLLGLNEMLSSMFSSKISLEFISSFYGCSLEDKSTEPFPAFDGSFLAYFPETISMKRNSKEWDAYMIGHLQSKLIELYSQNLIKQIEMSLYHAKGKQCQKQPLDWMSTSKVILEYCESCLEIRFDIGWNLPSCCSNSTGDMNQQTKRMRFEK
ncbi:OLC1v1020285C1 [Oldenlandia corymbosa var. corymbosa]|uniref:OLC1v1020285C1 n=1 Tax=Oldenlandia corymbosa var. corymbosa TaxID=529605 RepID=A0AAV1EG18_OLDCO|nr:OLC1v1020285C1 [Oldenlandia corymbosa var. corymbosa]